MIKYRLLCSDAHEFDAWFSSGASYDSQAARGLVTCPHCGTAAVEKALMAPNVATKSSRETTITLPQGDSGEERARSMVAVPAPQSEAQQQILALMRRVRQEVLRTAENVGPHFVEEVRKIHLDEAPARAIFGEATLADARALLEEGIEVMPLPILPEDRN